jgi:serine/threonine protein kinase
MTAPSDGCRDPDPGEGLSAAGLVVVLLEDQQRRWRGSERPLVEGYLARYPHLAAEADCVLQLLRGEFVLRHEHGETPNIEEYRQRFPAFAETLRQQLERLRDKGAELLTPASEAVTVAPVGADAAPPMAAPSTGWAPAVAGTVTKPVTIPGYEVYEVLGKGGMGVVYRARQIGLGRVVALKRILHAENAGPDERRRFQAEAEAIASLQHRHIVQIHEVGEADDLPFFSLEYCGGGSLEKRLHGTPWGAGPAARLVETLAEAVHTAHRAGIVHRDLKPANVLFTEDATPKITDFGLAKKLDATGHTQTGAVLGTPSYMAPEQAGAKGVKVGPATDVYALGAILYELLTGRPPFRAVTPLETVLQVLSDPPVLPSLLQRKIPRDLETICLKCLEKNPERRYASAADLAADLGRFLRGEPIHARRPTSLTRLRSWLRRPERIRDAGLIHLVVTGVILIQSVIVIHIASLMLGSSVLPLVVLAIVLLELWIGFATMSCRRVAILTGFWHWVIILGFLIIPYLDSRLTATSEPMAASQAYFSGISKKAVLDAPSSYSWWFVGPLALLCLFAIAAFVIADHAYQVNRDVLRPAKRMQRELHPFGETSTTGKSGT